MAFILSGERDVDVVAAFRRYRDYLETERSRFPPGALALATSDWYFDPRDHRSPHDGWLQHVVVHETGHGERHEDRRVEVSIQLLGAYNDLILTFTYAGVRRYALDTHDVRRGHGDWRYDEFRLGDAGQLIHEIEWSALEEAGRWVVEASDVRLEWSALARGA